MRFEWDPGKAAENLARHGVSFEEAATVFRDVLSATGADPDHSVDEERFVTFGISTRGGLLAIAHTKGDDTIRIIRARPATPSERRIYEQG
ncbi:MAG: BrnT family toxin [Candidatus Rokubacteria bacterium]|nr:BrnT family toxin [Candidatus Rokubacteria bacterium]